MEKLNQDIIVTIATTYMNLNAKAGDTPLRLAELYATAKAELEKMNSESFAEHMKNFSL